MFSARIIDQRSRAAGIWWLNRADRALPRNDRTFMFASTQWSTNMCERPHLEYVADAPRCARRESLSDRHGDANIVVVVFVSQHIFVLSAHWHQRWSFAFPEQIVCDARRCR